MSAHQVHEDVAQALGRIIGQHSAQLDGRTFQRLAMDAARAYFDESDLDEYGTFDDCLKALAQASDMTTKAAS